MTGFTLSARKSDFNSQEREDTEESMIEKRFPIKPALSIEERHVLHELPVRRVICLHGRWWWWQGRGEVGNNLTRAFS